jgi:argininosuccinate lyase
VVRYALGQDKELHELTLEELGAFSGLFAEDVFELLTPLQMINRRLSTGGTASKNVVRAIQKAKKVIGREAAEKKGDVKTKGAPK